MRDEWGWLDIVRLVWTLLRNKEEALDLLSRIKNFQKKILQESGNNVTDPVEAEKIAISTVASPTATAQNAKDEWMYNRESGGTP